MTEDIDQSQNLCTPVQKCFHHYSMSRYYEPTIHTEYSDPTKSRPDTVLTLPGAIRTLSVGLCRPAFINLLTL